MLFTAASLLILLSIGLLFCIYHRRLGEVMSEQGDFEELRERSRMAEHRIKVGCHLFENLVSNKLMTVRLIINERSTLNWVKSVYH